MTLLDRLLSCARLWAAANERSLARLATLVANDGNFFVRLESPSATTTAATLEKFARFLTDAGQWPDGQVPAEICAFAHVVGVHAEACSGSSEPGEQCIGSEAGPSANTAQGSSGRAPAAGRAEDSAAAGATIKCQDVGDPHPPRLARQGAQDHGG